MDFDLSKKEAIVSIAVNFSIKHKSKEGTSDKLHLFLKELNDLVIKHSTENILFKTSIENIITHKPKEKE